MSEAEFVVVGEIDRLKLYLQTRLACRSFEIVEFADQIKLSSYEHRRDLELLVIVSGRADLQDGLDLVRAVRAQGSRAVIVLLTRYSSEARVMAAFKAGVNDYFKWPWDYPELLASIKHNLAIVRRDSPNKEGGCSHDVSLDQSIIGESAAIRRIKAYIPKIAATDSTVLISGDTGTGKERVAHEIPSAQRL